MANTIDCSVVAVFDDRSEARDAVTELKGAGFNAHNIYVSSESAESATVGGGKVASPAGHESMCAKYAYSMSKLSQKAQSA